MSWLRKRGQSTTPSPGYTGPPSEPVPMYNPNQVFSTENVTPFYPYTENREIVRNSSPSLAQVQPMQYIPTQTFASQATTPSIPQEDITNPFKRASAQMQNTNNTMTSTQFMQNANPSNDYSSRQHAFSQHFSQSVNLETPPENSEQPDYMSNSAAEKPFAMPNLPPAPKAPVQQPWVGNSETIMTERNQYLETGHLSGMAEAPPPQVRMDYMTDYLMDDVLDRPRLEVVGRRAVDQMERNVENCNDEPPPGLSRMVLGQNEQNENGSEDASNLGFDGNGVNNSFEPISFPYGLRRMVPGESSSPENSTRQSTFQSQDINVPDSDPEFGGVPQLRSATIGADTPPTTSAPLNQVTLPSVGASDRSETIGAADEEEKPRGTSISPTNGKKTNRKAKEQTNDYVEAGQHTESEIGSIVASVRNLTVGENSTDETNDVGVKPEPRKKVSRPESSESETEKRTKTPTRERKDRRYKGERRDDRRERDNYSPESRARRYERRKYRDRNNDDSGDYYSDGERDKTKQDRDYDKKYYSLRKDKERDRRRKESPREYDRDGRRKRDEYYHRYEDSYDNEERSSRPSSRSDSMHDSMYRGSRRSEKDSRDRRRDRPAARDRERDKHRRPRDPYNPYNMPGYGGYDPYNPYYQQYQYQYYENLRRTNPQAYAEIYRKYYEQHAARHPPGYAPEDRSSVHSGRSSVNGDMAKDRFTRQSYYSHASVPYMADYYARDSQTNSISGHYDLDESSYSRQKDTTDSFILEDPSAKTGGRTTPAKFPTAHTKVSIACGRVVKVLPNYPQDGQPALVELAGLETYLQNDDEYRELAQYPGPLVKGATHKKTVIEYCENKIKNVGSCSDVCDPDSYVLMWEFLILLLRQNGKVVGTDIAELLLKNRTENLPVRPASVLSNISSTTGDVQAVSEASLPQVSESINFGSMSLLKEEEVTNKFREYLLYGSEQEALEWAMKHGLWGHALFLASKLGKRTHSNVMIRFANGLTMNDPLQTLYQLLSGRIPSAVSVSFSLRHARTKGVAEEKWGDWKPHLAMMLSNSSLQPELNRKAITAMGDTLMSRGSLCAAQFCYLMAETGFGRYGADNVKMVLLGSNHNKPFDHFATNEAVHMTEIYEYACSLNDPDFMLPELQVYKYLLATRLASFGLLQKSLAFLERIALYITNNPSNVQSSLVNNVCNLADRLKYYDPVSVDDEEESAEHLSDNRLDNTWLKTLKTLQDNINSGLMTYNANDMTLTDTIQSGTYGSTLDPARQNAWDQPQLYPQQYQGEVDQSPWQSDQQAQLDPSMDSYGQVDPQQLEGFTSYQDQQSYWANQQQQQWDSGINQQSNESLSQEQSNYYGSTNTQSEEDARPQISIPGQSKGRSIFDDDEPLPHEKAQGDKRQQQAKAEPAKQKESSGWFGGIFSKLAPKPKNQMKLPDDKNPTGGSSDEQQKQLQKIVWDEEKKRWVNVDEDNNNPSSNEIKPPPKMSDIMPATPKPQIPQANHTTTNNNNNNNAMPQGYTNPMSYTQNNNNNMNVPQQPLLTNNNNQQPQIGTPNQDGLSQQSNIFKLQKSRNLKKSYIDVFNPGGAATKPAVPAPQIPGFPVANNAPQMNFFIPQPVTDPNAPTNFLTQGNPVIQPQYDESAQGRR